jgi:amino acid transporter
MTHLKRSLEFNDLMAIGVASIMGSGGFNLIGDGIMTGGPYFPLSLGAVTVLFQGLSHIYKDAYHQFKTNTSESNLIKEQFGSIPEKISSIAIIFFNILSVSTILVISSKLLLPKGSWSGQVGFAIAILASMTAFSLKGIEINKELINIFTYGIVVLLILASMIGLIEFGQKTEPLKFPEAIRDLEFDFGKSLLYFFFIFAGFDVLMKFSEEAVDPDRDIPRAFFGSNAISALLTAGVCFSFLVVFSKEKFSENENIIARIAESMMGKQAGVTVGLISVLLMVVTSFISFLATTRYMYGLGREYPALESFTRLNENKVPWIPVIVTCLIAAAAILNNNVFTLVKLSDVTLTVTLLLVSAASLRGKLTKGKVPIIEGVTTASLLGLLWICCNPFF